MSRHHFEDIGHEREIALTQATQRRDVVDQPPEGVLRVVVKAARRVRDQSLDLRIGQGPITGLPQDLPEQAPGVALYPGGGDRGGLGGSPAGVSGEGSGTAATTPGYAKAGS